MYKLDQVPDFHWNVFSDKIPFEIKDTGITITPFTGMCLILVLIVYGISYTTA